MTLKAVVLDDFDTQVVNTTPPTPEQEQASNEEWLDVFERGYKDGWDDAVKASDAEQERIGADFANNLADLGFTYHEAHTAVLKEMRGLLEGLLKKVLPATVSELLGHQLLEELSQIVRQQADVIPTIIVAPENLGPIESLLERQQSLKVRILEEPSLGPGQAHLQLGVAEHRIDLDAALDGLTHTITEFFDQLDQADQTKERAYG
ncbi:MAG: flagellar biosynthesis protein [Pseudomonadota bacterium]